METAMRIFQTIVGSLICYALSGPVISVSHAESGEDLNVCEIATIKEAFLPVNFKATPEQIKQIRLDLKKSNLVPGTEDGVLGEEDYVAFAKICKRSEIEKAFKDDISEQPENEQEEASVKYRKSLADKLVKLLPVPPNTGTDPTDEPKICEIASIKNAFSHFEATKEYIKRIQLQLKISGFNPGVEDGILGDITYTAFANLCDANKMEEDFKAELKKQPEDKQAVAAEKYKQELAFSLVALVFDPPINMKGAGCGCSLKFSRTVYGVYPYLRTDGGAMEVNFDLLDRIGFYGLVLDRSGEIQDDLGWHKTDGNVANFIYEAHRHRVKADVTFVATDWTNWDFAKMSRAAKNVAEIAGLKFRSNNDPLNRIAMATGHSVDGVNLFFKFKDDETPAGSEKLHKIIKNLHKIVSQVSEKLTDIGSDATINIVLGLDLSDDRNSNAYVKLREILRHDKSEIAKILITLKKMDAKSGVTGETQTTEKSKIDSVAKRRHVNQILMQLRWQIEKAYEKPQGLPEFDTVIRKILPIVMTDESSHKPLDGKDSQFRVDLAYLEDNFGGVALTPLPLKSAASAKDISEALIDKFDTGGSDSALCQFVCPNRVLVYAFLGVLFFLMVAFRLATMLNCQVSSVYQKTVYVALLLGSKVIFLGMLGFTLNCDPDLADNMLKVVGLFALLFSVSYVYGFFSRLMRPALP